MFNARVAMLDFGFLARVANTPIFVVGNVCTTCSGFLTLLFCARQQIAVVGTGLAVTGAYAGPVDSYVAWKHGNPRIAPFHLESQRGLPSDNGSSID
ncbi:hypothetical protein F4859DRAFT_471553 [Xylaria cf. heliscus]|nr:hypothetical protein F4859DRAFT_471553 [Xylaria cf. heliscus]